MKGTNRKRAFSDDSPGEERPSPKRRNCHCYKDHVFLQVPPASLDDAIEFIERTMAQEGWLDYGDDCVLRHHQIKEELHCLEMASWDLAEKACCLDRVFFQNYQVRINKGFSARPKFSCWNEYFWHTHGRNATDTYEWVHVSEKLLDKDCDYIGGDGLVEFLNKKMLRHRLCTLDAIVAITPLSCRAQEKVSYFVKARTPFIAEMLCCFSGIKHKKSRLLISRLHGWHGPKPRYRCYGEFIARGDQFNLFYLSRYPADWDNEKIRSFLNEKCKDLQKPEDQNDPIVDINRDEKTGCLVLVIFGPDSKDLVELLNEEDRHGFGPIERYSSCNVYVYRLPAHADISKFCSDLNSIRPGVKLIEDRRFCTLSGIHCLTMPNAGVARSFAKLFHSEVPRMDSVRMGQDPLDCDYRTHVVTVELSEKDKNISNADLISVIDRKMKDYGLLSATTAISRCWYARSLSLSPSNSVHRALTMIDADKAEKITYLNGMPLHDDSDAVLSIRRHDDYTGPGPKYSSYAAFMESRKAESAKRPSDSFKDAKNFSVMGEQHPVKSPPRETSRCCGGEDSAALIEDVDSNLGKAVGHDSLESSCGAANSEDDAAGNGAAGTSPEERTDTRTDRDPSSPTAAEATVDGPPSVAAPLDDAVRKEKRIALENENSHLKLQIEALSNSNLQKVELKAKLNNQISNLRDQLVERQQAVTLLRKNNIESTTEVMILQSRLNDVHTSWQEQVSDLALKQVEIEGLNNQVKQLQKQSQNVTDSLLDERKLKKHVKETTRNFQMKHEELENQRRDGPNSNDQD
eukprot:scaffold1525_cov142-Cylindrotheca_fusiformis.AAC.1